MLTKELKELGFTSIIKINNTGACANFPKGEWTLEPDIITMIHKESGYKCKIQRMITLGHLCGYVNIPENHSVFAKHYNEIHDIFVHGGLTYSEFENKPEDDADYWIGFDCAHSWDLSPGTIKMYEDCGIIQDHKDYKNIQYVANELKSLAEQLMKI